MGWCEEKVCEGLVNSEMRPQEALTVALNASILLSNRCFMISPHWNTLKCQVWHCEHIV